MASNSDDCPVCLAPLAPPSLSIPCGHVFHASCLCKLFQHGRGASCPTCRAPIELDRLKGAEAVEGAARRDGGYGHYAMRSRPLEPLQDGTSDFLNLLRGSGQWGGQGAQAPQASGTHAGAAAGLGAGPAEGVLQLRAAQRWQVAWQLGQQGRGVEQWPWREPVAAGPGTLRGHRWLGELGTAAEQDVAQGMGRLGLGQPGLAQPTDCEQVVDRVLPEIPQVFARPNTRSNHAFVLDISASMGTLGAWSPQACSRLSLALSYCAAYIDRAIPAGDTFCVLAFSQGVHVICDWQYKPSPSLVYSGTFNKQAFLRACEEKIRGVPRGGTSMCLAFSEACRRLRERADRAAARLNRLQSGSEGAAAEAGAAVGAAAGPAGERGATGPAAQPLTSQLILLTDGEATDGEEAFEAARQLACLPEMDFKALLIKIDAEKEEAVFALPCRLEELCKYPDSGSPILYIMRKSFKLPEGRIDSWSNQSMRTVASLGQTTREFGRIPSAGNSAPWASRPSVRGQV